MISITKLRSGTVTSPRGFKASGLHCGIKTKSKKPDLVLIVSDVPAVSAATFTRNKLKAWPVLFSMKSIKQSEVHSAIVANSGNANCANGPRGEQATQETVRVLAETLKISEKEILICSTGLIGVRLPVAKITQAIPRLVKRLSVEGGHKAARGILTTDIRTKELAISFALGGTEVRMGAIAKGVGMVHPHMATMLNFITTDCAITRPLLFRALRAAVARTFNMMSIDNDISTNDTVFLIANGLAENPRISRVDSDYRKFEEALFYVTTHVARELVRDGEGATKFCELHVMGARRRDDAEKVARTIANSMLFKTMLTGSDPNWGRIAAAVGASGVPFSFNRLSIGFDGIKLLSSGKFMIRNQPEVRRILRKKEYVIHVDLGFGKQEARFFTSDLSKGYVHINASYST